MIATKPTTQTNTFTNKIYWLNRLSGELPITKIITDYVTSPDSSQKNRTYQFELPITVSRQIIKFTQGSNLAIYSLLLACLKILLQKYTDSQEIIIGSPCYSELNTNNSVIPIKKAIAENLTFKNFLLEIKETLIQAYLHQDYDFTALKQLLELPLDNDFIDIIFCLTNIHDCEKIANLNNTLTITCLVDDDKITGKILYSDLLFKEATIESISRTYLRIIEQVINDVEIKISDISFLTERESKQLLLDFNNNAKDYPINKTIPELFAEQVRQTPNRIAVVDEQTALTYQQLNEQANQLARLLLNLGVQPQEFIGIYKQRDFNFLIAILAVLKAGAVYVPLDNTYPAERINYMLSNSQVRFLLTDTNTIKVLLNANKSHSQIKYLLCLDSQTETTLDDLTILGNQSWQNLSTTNSVINQTGIAPAYTIYTSGSTGLPKGTIIRHNGAINHIYAQYDALNLNSELTFLQSAPASSDISIWQFLAPLLIGGKTIIINTETVCNPEKLLQIIQQNKITLVEFVPVILKSLLDYCSSLPTEKRLLPSLQWLMVTGESVSVDLVNNWLKLYPTIPVINAYGPSEAADDITQDIITQPLPSDRRSVTIGKPLANLNLYILDRNLQLLPIGIPGEICVSGYGVGLGYWQNEEKTKASFVNNPFLTLLSKGGRGDHHRLYKTGDLGRWLPDGRIEYLGRIDNQVKIRGFRLELGEIEAQLRQNPGVKDNVVIVREDIADSKRLVAYIVPQVDDKELIGELRSFLKQRLPEYMLPSSFIVLDTLPLAPSGKIDRHKLPAPETTTSESNKTFIKPRTTVEEILASIWQEVLGIEEIGIYDNFFELGGDSILCIQAIAKSHQEQLNLTFKQMFEQQTIAKLAGVVNQTSTIANEQGILTGEVSLTPIQHYILEQNLVNPHHWNEAVLLEVSQRLNCQCLEAAIQQILIHHDALRLGFEQTPSSWRGIYLPSEAATPFVYVDLSDLPSEKQNAALETTANQLQQSLDISQGNNLKVAWFDLGKDKNSRLLVIIHHLVVDSISWRILLEDLQTAYQQLEKAEGRGQKAEEVKKIQLPPKTASLRQWTQKLQEYANSEQLQPELDYWLNPSRQHINSLPTDYLDGNNNEASAATISLQLTASDTQILLQEISTLHRLQINDLLLISLAQALTQWMGCKQLLVDLENHGREEIGVNLDISRTVGLFSSIFPVYLDLETASTPETVLKTLKQQLHSIPNKGIGYGILRYLNNNPQIRESLKSFPQAEIAFNYLGQFDSTFSESSLFKLARESTGAEASGQNQRSHLLSFGAFIINSQLEINCTYSCNLHQSNTIDALLQKWLKVLQEIIRDSQSSNTESLITSDFPLIQMSQEQLDAALNMVEF
jgi:amino acid adenylation domain-containing protein/non-ribosomal peptide synthase protein (TIGR01720 family)